MYYKDKCWSRQQDFGPDGFSPDGFSPDGFSPDGFSPDGFGRSGRSGCCKCCRWPSFPCCPHGCMGPGTIEPGKREALVAYGGLYNDADQMITIAPDGTQVISIPEFMAASNVILANSLIIIQKTGVYRIDLALLLQSTSGTSDATVAVARNGVPMPELTQALVLGAAFQTVAINALVKLEAGDQLNVSISSVAGGSILFGPSLNASLSVMLVDAKKKNNP